MNIFINLCQRKVKGFFIIMTTTVSNSNTERQFLIDIACLLQRSDLSKLDLRTTTGPQKHHRTHSILIDNYEISITRTPVYAYETTLHQLFNRGDWQLLGDRFERYEIYISENMYNIRMVEVPFAAMLHSGYNVVMHHGTMASDMGHYRARSYQKRGLTSKQQYDLYQSPNYHLFEPCRDIFTLLDCESSRRRLNMPLNNLSPIRNGQDMDNARNRMLGCIEQRLLKTK